MTFDSEARGICVLLTTSDAVLPLAFYRDSNAVTRCKMVTSKLQSLYVFRGQYCILEHSSETPVIPILENLFTLNLTL